MYSTGMIVHEGRCYSPDGLVVPGKSDLLDCGHIRPEITDLFAPWGIVQTSDGPQEYCVECCEALEVAAVKQLPPGAGYTAYYDKSQITTWRGTKLMRVVDYTIYRHNFGGRFVAITAIDDLGRYWHGRASYDNGDCINLYQSKAKSTK